MSLWKRGIERTKDVKKSEELVAERDKLAAKWPSVEAAWNKENLGPVRQAAEELSIREKMVDPEGILKARQNLQQTLWKRDAPKEEFQRELDQLNEKIGALIRPIIFEKCKEWQGDLSSLQSKKIVEKISTRFDFEKNVYRILYKSNLPLISKTKDKLGGAILELRRMESEGLGKVYDFISKTELELKEIDFNTLIEMPEVSERTFQEILAEPGVKSYTTAHFIDGSKPGITKIEKNYDLPQKGV